MESLKETKKRNSNQREASPKLVSRDIQNLWSTFCEKKQRLKQELRAKHQEQESQQQMVQILHF